MTPEEIRQGEVAIAKAMGCRAIRDHGGWYFLVPQKHTPGLAACIADQGSQGCTNAEAAFDIETPSFSSDGNAHLELMKWLRDRERPILTPATEGGWFCAGRSGNASAEDQAMAAFLLALKNPEVQAHLSPTKATEG